LAISGQTAGNPLVVCGAEAATSTRSVQRRQTLIPLQQVATAGWRKQRKLIPPIIGVANTPEKSSKKGRHRDHRKLPRGGVFCSHRITAGVSFAAALRGSAEQQQQQPQANHVTVTSPPATGIKNIPASALQQLTGQSVQAPLVNSQPLDNMLRVVNVVQQIMTKVSGALSEEDKIVVITKIVLKLMNQNGH
jgi:hypothetical protein